jgi:hypothetical protein
MQRDDFRDDLPVSRGQWRAIALALLAQAAEPAPTSRMAATRLLVRLEDGRRITADPAPVGVAE